MRMQKGLSIAAVGILASTLFFQNCKQNNPNNLKPPLETPNNTGGTPEPYQNSDQTPGLNSQQDGGSQPTIQFNTFQVRVFSPEFGSADPDSTKPMDQVPYFLAVAPEELPMDKAIMADVPEAYVSQKQTSDLSNFVYETDATCITVALRPVDGQNQIVQPNALDRVSVALALYDRSLSKFGELVVNDQSISIYPNGSCSGSEVYKANTFDGWQGGGNMLSFKLPMNIIEKVKSNQATYRLKVNLEIEHDSSEVYLRPVYSFPIDLY